MGALVRGRQASRYRSIAQIDGISDEKLDAIIDAYEDGDDLDAALDALTIDEYSAIQAFNVSLRNATHANIKKIILTMENVEDKPGQYDMSDNDVDKIDNLLSDILDDIP